jgi:hypothetical protein
MNWTCDACGRAPADVDELLHWPTQTEGGTLCPNCDQGQPQHVEPVGPQWGGAAWTVRSAAAWVDVKSAR